MVITFYATNKGNSRAYVTNFDTFQHQLYREHSDGQTFDCSVDVLWKLVKDNGEEIPGDGHKKAQ